MALYLDSAQFSHTLPAHNNSQCRNTCTKLCPYSTMPDLTLPLQYRTRLYEAHTLHHSTSTAQHLTSVHHARTILDRSLLHRHSIERRCTPPKHNTTGPYYARTKRYDMSPYQHNTNLMVHHQDRTRHHVSIPYLY